MKKAWFGIIIGSVCLVWASVNYASYASADTQKITQSAVKQSFSLKKPLLLAEVEEVRKVPKPKPKPTPEPKPEPKPDPKPEPKPDRCPDFDGDGRPDC
jgi:hypothetical protein